MPGLMRLVTVPVPKGTLNIRYLNAKLIAGSNSYIRKVKKYNVNEAKHFIENYDLEFKPEVIVYQFGGNDIEGVNGFEFLDQIVELVSTSYLKFPGIKVMVSLGLPRRQRSANLKVIEQSNKLVQKLKAMIQSSCATTANCFFKGKPLNGVLID